MTRYVALLRGVNLGGRRRVEKGALLRLVESLGHGDVVTYIQSGNVLFDSPVVDARALAEEMELRLLDAFGFGVDVVVRSAAEMAAILVANPFVAGGAETKTLYYSFARDPISGDPAIDRRYAPDAFSLAPSLIYLHCPAGFGTTKLTDTVLVRLAGSSVTTRNWNTVTRLAELAGGRT